MKGCRMLNRQEKYALLNACSNAKEKAFLAVGFAAGYRVSEIISLKISDVIDGNSKPLKYISVARVSMKGKKEGRRIPLNSAAANALSTLAKELVQQGCCREQPLFTGRKCPHKAVTRITAWRWLKDLLARADISGGYGELGTHCLRKTFAGDMLQILGDSIPKLQVAMGHCNPATTMRYISVDHSEIELAFTKLI